MDSIDTKNSHHLLVELKTHIATTETTVLVLQEGGNILFPGVQLPAVEG